MTYFRFPVLLDLSPPQVVAHLHHLEKSNTKTKSENQNYIHSSTDIIWETNEVTFVDDSQS